MFQQRLQVTHLFILPSNHLPNAQPSPALWEPHDKRFPGSYMCMCTCSVTSVVSDSLRPCELPGSSVHGTLQARILEWVAVLQGIFPTQGFILHLLRLLHCRQILCHWATEGALACTHCWTNSSALEPGRGRMWGSQWQSKCRTGPVTNPKKKPKEFQQKPFGSWTQLEC